MEKFCVYCGQTKPISESVTNMSYQKHWEAIFIKIHFFSKMSASDAT
jgi:hypothetical protein